MFSGLEPTTTTALTVLFEILIIDIWSKLQSQTYAYNGNAYVNAVVRGSNDVVGDGIEVALLNGTSTLDSEIYTQEGLAGNEHTFSLAYTLPVLSGTLYTLTTQISAVTGGTVSAKLVNFTVRDQW